ncbi:N-acetyltransferase ESCO2 isoform X2 [Anthonomus grandis grandis]|uniref:N-acetyltransferase ESCO2 isoform X2 n=1 Tax=Anthonomus grandis grandis TaxID=2921223 RepID=UPI002164F9A7|nr:N-acetyltransferase ESCO2 isoform X2 [Anthonomus grandis grandis]
MVSDMEEKRKKLFPIFYKGTSSGIETNRQERGGKRERSGDIVKRSAKKFKGLDPDQMLLDAGQKKFGLTLCNECKTMYHMGDPNDETQHLNYHNAHNVLKFSGWKNEHVVANFQSQDRIIRVMPTDSKIWIKKVKDLMQVVLRDMGCYDMEYDLNNSQVYLYIKSRTIAGCVVATSPKEGGHRMLPTIGGISMCSEESYPIKCGLTFMWVAQNFRRQGIASALVTAVKNNFVFGHILSNDDVALTSPTEDGAAFAEKYFNSANYLVYYV